MTKIGTLFLLIFGFCHIYAQNRFVYMGELLPSFTDFNAIRFDGVGEIYPEVSIPIRVKGCYNNERKERDPATVRDFYVSDCFLRNKIFEYYNIDSCSNLKFESIQKIVVQAKIDAINTRLEKEEIDNVTFIMVGYNNHFKNDEDENDCAPKKLSFLHQKVETFLSENGKRSLIVEIYWDGTQTESEGIRTALNFHYASVNSYWAGLGLRKIVNGLHCKEVKFISHSMGANVVTECIFNQYSKIKQHTNFARELNKLQKEIQPPDKKMTAALIAPAISGMNTFIDYFETGIKANCTFIIGYNVNDSILAKKFEKIEKVEPDYFITHFGCTSLGCLKQEITATEELFCQHNAKLILIDFSKDINGNPQERHELIYYLVLPQYDTVLKNLFDIK
ncbi:MAG: hypothetical protein NTW54_03915 [Bacteroidetes bacterium]|nr:hypothetical protein [Bacteroidota bacterium]